MKKKKNKFFTLIFSMMFGAGQMYMGFMKQGLSLMTATAVIIFLGSWLNIGPILFALPVLWFYSFFDSINKMSLSDEEFHDSEDCYFFIQNIENVQIKKLVTKYNNMIAVVLILLGVSVLGENILDYMSQIVANLFPRFINIVDLLRWNASRILFAIVIIVIGVKMIIGKKSELDTQVLQLQISSIDSQSQSIKEDENA